MSHALEPYREKILELYNQLKEKLGEEDAKIPAILFVLANEYGDGDAWAGLVLGKVKQENIDEFVEIMVRHGILEKKPRKKTVDTIRRFLLINRAFKKIMSENQ